LQALFIFNLKFQNIKKCLENRKATEKLLPSP